MRTPPWKAKPPNNSPRKSACRAKGACRSTRCEASHAQLEKLSGWRLTHDGQRIRKDWVVKNFMAGMEFFNRVAEVAEDEGHHPGLAPGRLSQRGDRNLHARHRRAVGERLHSGRQDRQAADHASRNRQATRTMPQLRSRRVPTLLPAVAAPPLRAGQHASRRSPAATTDLLRPRKRRRPDQRRRLRHRRADSLLGRLSGPARGSWPSTSPRSTAAAGDCSNWAAASGWRAWPRPRPGFEVLATDYYADALEFTAANAQRQRLERSSIPDWSTGGSCPTTWAGSR